LDDLGGFPNCLVSDSGVGVGEGSFGGVEPGGRAKDGTIGVLRSTFSCRYPQLACRGCDVAAVCRWTRLCWAKRRPAGELLMTAPHARRPEVLPRPACTPTAIRAVLAASAGGDILQRYDEDLDAAFEQVREQGDVTPLVQTVKRWWFEADACRDP
jgi:Family of unknown function (DUF6247)